MEGIPGFPSVSFLFEPFYTLQENCQPSSNCQTIVPKGKQDVKCPDWKGQEGTIGNMHRLSVKDVEKINNYYACNVIKFPEKGVLLPEDSMYLISDSYSSLDCLLSEWSSWSPLGDSQKESRTKTILIHPSRDRKPCHWDRNQTRRGKLLHFNSKRLFRVVRAVG